MKDIERLIDVIVTLVKDIVGAFTKDDKEE